MTSALAPLSITHAELIAGLHQICFKEPWNQRAMAELLIMPGVFGWLAVGKQPCGFVLARLAADEAEILTLLVLPPFRRQGIAERLLSQAANHARTGGASKLFLEVAADNQAALALYRRNGFEPVGKRPRYYGDGGDALLMAKDFSINNR